MTYESSVGLENISVNNTTTIPPPTCLPYKDIIKDVESCTVCFFDIETTGLSEILRLFRFQLLILMVWDGLITVYPNGSITFRATKVTGITKSSWELFCHGKLVDTVNMNVGLKRFGL